MAGFWLKRSGRIGIALCPRGGEWLEDDVRAWQAAGVSVVVSCLEPAEAIELQLRDEAAACTRHGMDFVPFPIPDRGVPKSHEAFMNFMTALRKDLAAGEAIAVHCRQGIGRSALVVASVLVLNGEKPNEALRKIGEARGCDVPDTAEQRAWVQSLSRATD